MHQSFVFAIFIFLSVQIVVHTETKDIRWETEVEALKHFKLSIIDGPFGSLKDWTNAIHHCNWSGITCDSSDRVVNITLEQQNLHGSISPFIGNLTSLQVVDLGSNSFFGHIPYQLLQCSNLAQLDLYNNSLSGEIPGELGYLKYLNYLDLQRNSFYGSIPDSICNCTALEQVPKYMETGNLDKIIHGSFLDEDKWTITERIDVSISIASGIVYLHSGYDIPIVHCDLKPANVLLDVELVAHVSDFGTSRMLGIHSDNRSNIATSSAFEGTIGYLAPEFAYTRTITTKMDVFSFGVLILELITKRRPRGLTNEEGEPLTLSQLVQQSLENGINGLVQVLDPQLLPDVLNKHEDIEGLLTLALSCTKTDPKDRPDMEEVLTSLTKLKAISSRREKSLKTQPRR